MKRGIPKILALAIFMIAGALGHAQDTRIVVPADEAADHVGKKVIVEMKVAASKNSRNRNCYFLDSTEDYRDAKNFTVLITYEEAEGFRKKGIADPSTFYFGKKIRVSGTVIEEDDQIRIRATDPAQIEVLPPVPGGG